MATKDFIHSLQPLDWLPSRAYTLHVGAYVSIETLKTCVLKHTLMQSCAITAIILFGDSTSFSHLIHSLVANTWLN